MNALEIQHLTKKFSGFSLDDLNLTLPGGCILGLVGENGAGKSTTMKLILNMLRPDSGSVRILGRSNQKDLALTLEDVGVVLDNVGIPGCLDAHQVGKVMALTYKHWEQSQYDRLLEQLSVPTNKRFHDLSKGMKMKLGIAIALSHRAKLLLLDEATSGLDPVVRDEVVQMLRDFVCDDDHAVLISSHIVSDLEKLCDYIAFLHKGKLLLMEEKDQLLAEYGLLLCAPEELDSIPEKAIKGKKVSAYSAKALVLRSQVPQSMNVTPITLEDLFLYFVKEAG